MQGFLGTRRLSESGVHAQQEWQDSEISEH